MKQQINQPNGNVKVEQMSQLPLVSKKNTVLSIGRSMPNIMQCGNNPNLNIRISFSRSLQNFASTVQTHYLTRLTQGLSWVRPVQEGIYLVTTLVIQLKTQSMFFECPTCDEPRVELQNALLRIGPIMVSDKTLFNLKNHMQNKLDRLSSLS